MMKTKKGNYLIIINLMNLIFIIWYWISHNFRQNDRERTKEQLDADKKMSYAGVPSAVLYCHVCSKHMWDSEVW
jgi:hypothetical protein